MFDVRRLLFGASCQYINLGLLCLADIHKFSINPLLCFQRSLDVLEVAVGSICVTDISGRANLLRGNLYAVRKVCQFCIIAPFRCEAVEQEYANKCATDQKGY